jgi:hypothetical protein
VNDDSCKEDGNACIISLPIVEDEESDGGEDGQVTKCAESAYLVKC